MNVIFQNDRRLNRQINLYGCRFRCLQAIAEFSLGKALTVEQIEMGYQEAIKNKNVMKPNCACGKDEHEIINYAFKMLNSGLEGKQIGGIDSKGNLTFWDGQKKGYDFIIDRWTTKTGYHFILAFLDKDYWNPWSTKFDAKLTVYNNTQKLLYKTTKL